MSIPLPQTHNQSATANGPASSVGVEESSFVGGDFFPAVCYYTLKFVMYCSLQNPPTGLSEDAVDSNGAKESFNYDYLPPSWSTNFLYPSYPSWNAASYQMDPKFGQKVTANIRTCIYLYLSFILTYICRCGPKSW